MTDAHCHPTDLTHKPEIYDEVPLGGLASMGTTVEDQEKVYELGRQRGWKEGSISRGIKEGVKVVSCFGKSAADVDSPSIRFSPPRRLICWSRLCGHGGLLCAPPGLTSLPCLSLRSSRSRSQLQAPSRTRQNTLRIIAERRLPPLVLSSLHARIPPAIQDGPLLLNLLSSV